MTGIRRFIGRYLVAGVLTFAPIGITIWAIAWIIQRLDSLLLPRVLRLLFPDLEAPPNLPFVGAIFTLFVILLFGVVARHLFGREIVRLWERLLSRVPVARNIYAAIKQLFDAIFASDPKSKFRRVVLVEYPRKGVYALAFTTGPARGPAGSAAAPELGSASVSGRRPGLDVGQDRSLQVGPQEVVQQLDRVRLDLYVVKVIDLVALTAGIAVDASVLTAAVQVHIVLDAKPRLRIFAV